MQIANWLAGLAHWPEPWWFGPNLVRPSWLGRTQPGPFSLSLTRSRTQGLAELVRSPLLLTYCPGVHGSAAPPPAHDRLGSSPTPTWWGSGPPRRDLPLCPDRFDFTGLVCSPTTLAASPPLPHLRSVIAASMVAARRRCSTWLTPINSSLTPPFSVPAHAPRTKP
jgi:hypothetical protein